MRLHLATAAVLGLAAAGSGRAVQPAAPDTAATATYLANEGVLVASGDTKIAFDPIFRQDFGQYQLLPEDLERALFAGEPPFDGLDAIFISHYHEDHFSPRDLLLLLQRQPRLQLYAPAQAVATMKPRNDEGRAALERVTSLSLGMDDPPLRIEAGPLLVEAFRIPHSGWPERSDVENLAYRVTLDHRATVVHMGDADAHDAHFARDAERWRSAPIDLAFPPYWFFDSEEGRRVLDERLQPAHAVGIHVPVSMPHEAAERPEAFRDRDLFQVPGETREIPARR